MWVGDETGHDIVLKLFGSAASSISLELSYLILGMYNYSWSARVAYLKVYKMEDMKLVAQNTKKYRSAMY